MSNQITTARVQGFKRGIDILSQQKGSRLQNTVNVEMQSSKQEHYDQVRRLRFSEPLATATPRLSTRPTADAL